MNAKMRKFDEKTEFSKFKKKMQLAMIYYKSDLMIEPSRNLLNSSSL